MFKIRQGGKAVLPFRLRDKNDDPIDLTTVTAISTCFKNISGPNLAVSLTGGIAIIGNPILGKIEITLTAAETALLAPCADGADLELSVTLGTDDPIKSVLLNCYGVIESVC